MKIVNQVQVPKGTFGALKVGDGFMCSGSVYVKCDQQEICAEQGTKWVKFNCFNLRTLRVGLYSKDTVVVPVDLTLTVSECEV